MITIPLATVVSYLTRKGIDPVEVLEGAPIHMPHIGDGLITFEAPDVSWGDGVHLYLGRDAVCPAAMGWVLALLSTTLPSCTPDNPSPPVVYLTWGLNGSLVLQCVTPEEHGVWWFGKPRADLMWPILQRPAPDSPAARLRAVLEYEMGRP